MQEIKCDFCGNDVKDEHDGVVSGQVKYKFSLDNKNHDVLIIFMNHYGDRSSIDICKKCLKKGGIGN